MTKYGFFSAVCVREGDGLPGRKVDPDKVDRDVPASTRPSGWDDQSMIITGTKVDDSKWGKTDEAYVPPAAVKPDVMAQGSSTAYATNDMAFTGNGTSFSCPLISGMAACLWQLNPSKSNMEIFRQIVESADRASFPDNNYGYGIPNFEHAFYQIGLQQSLSQLRVDIFPNPVENTIYISTNLGDREEEVSIRITDLTGNLLSEMKVSLENDGMAELDFPYSSGIYIMQLTIGETSIVKKILK